MHLSGGILPNYLKNRHNWQAFIDNVMSFQLP